MDLIITRIKNLLLVPLLVVSVACGGGGGDGGGNESDSTFTISSNQLNFTAVEGALRPASQNITGTVTGAVDVQVVPIVAGAGIERAVFIAGAGDTGQVTVVAKMPATVGIAGTYQGTVTIYVCPVTVANCVASTAQISGSPKVVKVTYIISPAPNNAVTVNGKVYDAELAGAQVVFKSGLVTLATTTTNLTGDYSALVAIPFNERAKALVVTATRGTAVLRSLLGNAGYVADSTGGVITGNSFASANVSNVTTAMIAVIESMGALPTSQVDIDAAINTITTSAMLRAKVLQISAALKAVIDYGANPRVVSATASNTNLLAKALAASTTVSADIDALLLSMTSVIKPTLAQLSSTVTNDPVLAAQLPADTAVLAAAIVKGNSYAIVDSGQFGNIIVFDGAGKYIDYSNINMDTPETGTYNVSGAVITLTSDGAPVTVITARVIAGNYNSVQVDAINSGGGNGIANLRRVIPVVTTGNAANEIDVSALINKILVDVEVSQAALIPSVCDGSVPVDGVLVTNKASVTGVACQAHASGMLKLTSPNPATVNTVYLGFLADSWNGGVLSTSMNIALYNNTDASFNRGYQAKDVDGVNGGPINNPIALRVHWNKKVSLRIVTTGAATPTMADYYRNKINNTTNAFTQNIAIAQTVNVFGPLTLNYSTLSTSNTRLRYSVNLGKQSGIRLRATFQSSDNTTALPTSLNNNLGSLNTRAVYKLTAFVAADIFTGPALTAVKYKMTNIVDPARFNLVDINNDAGKTGQLTNQDGVITAFTWAVSSVNSAIPASVASYPATLTLTETVSGNKRYYYIDKTFGLDNFVIGSFKVNAAGIYANVRGFTAIRQ